MRWLSVLLLAWIAAPASADPILMGRLANLQPIRLHAGANTIPNFSDDQRDALVILAWRDNGNAHGHDAYMVLLPTRKGATDWNVVGMPSGSSYDDTIDDDPHTGDDNVKSVRLVRGLFDGRQTTMLITSTRDFPQGGGIPDPSKTVIEIDALRVNTEGVGEPRDFFDPVLRYRTITNYCNAEMALQTEISLPVPRSYSGPHTRSGCTVAEKR